MRIKLEVKFTHKDVEQTMEYGVNSVREAIELIETIDYDSEFRNVSYKVFIWNDISNKWEEERKMKILASL